MGRLPAGGPCRPDPRGKIRATQQAQVAGHPQMTTSIYVLQM